MAQRRPVLPLLVFACTAAIAVPPGLRAQDSGLDIEYAEHVPLASRSLLLEAIHVDGRIVAVGERGHIVLSDDEGLSWRQAEVVPTRSTLTSVFAAGKRIWAAGHDTTILTSGDGGLNWTRQYFDPERQQPVMDLYFSDESRGIATGAYNLLLVTADGGQTWEDRPLDVEYDAHLNSVAALGGGVLLIAGEGGYSYRSLDAGEHWEPMTLPYHGSMFEAYVPPGGCALLLGLRGHVMRSCDAGEHWEDLVTGTEETLLGVAPFDGGVLLAGNGGTLLLSRPDGGFDRSNHSSGVDFSCALSLGDGRVLLTGEEGVYFFPEQAEGGPVR